ncbi:MAG TPA: polysaccharide lyase 6 family protein [Candidatus Eisenbacteria bacterium]
MPGRPVATRQGGHTRNRPRSAPRAGILIAETLALGLCASLPARAAREFGIEADTAYCVTVIQPPAGTIALSPAGGLVPPGTQVTATFSPSPGYRLCGWLGALSGTGTVRSFVVDRDRVVGAETCADPDRPPAGRLIPAASIAALKEALAGALPGDVIEMAEGSYSDSGTIAIARGGVEGFPVTLRARTRGGVVLAGALSFEVRKTAHVTVEGLVFETSAAPAIEIKASHHVRVTRNAFRLHETVPGNWVLVDGGYGLPEPWSHDNRIDHNRFEGKSQPGNFVTVRGSSAPDARSSQRDRIDRNYFRQSGPRIPNGMEAVRLGSSAMSRSSGFTTVESNLFEDCDGDPEIVSVKASDDVVRFNTIRHCQGTVTLRHGDRSAVEGNFFFGDGKQGTGGVRLYGDDHVVFNNYFEGLTGTGWDAPLALTNGDADYDTSADLSRHYRPRRAVIAFNTFVANAHGLQIGNAGSGLTLPPVDPTLEYNLVAGGEDVLVRIFTAPLHATWRDNLMWPTGAAALGIVARPGEIAVADPMMVRAGGLWRVGAFSPAVDGAGEGLVFVLGDMDGQARSVPDIGADEYSSGRVARRPLTPGDVGPDAAEGDAVTDVTPGGAPDAPGVVLEPAAPNPFSSATRIRFTLPSPCAVTLAIYDVAGRRRAVLLDGPLPAGPHQVEWRAREMAPGVYLCRLRAGAANLTGKLLRIP